MLGVRCVRIHDHGCANARSTINTNRTLHPGAVLFSFVGGEEYGKYEFGRRLE